MNPTKIRGSGCQALGLLVLLAVWSADVAAGDGVVFELRAASAETYAEPHDVVLSPDGGLLYVADNGNDRIAVLDARTLREVGIFARGEVSAPHDVDFDSRGRLLVADTGNHRIAIYEVDGASVRLDYVFSEAPVAPVPDSFRLRSVA